MYKAKASDIKWLTESEWSNEAVEAFGNVQPSGIEIAYYSPSGANWSYTIMITAIDGKFYELVTRFGAVEGGREINLEHYNKWNTERQEGK